DLKTSLQESLRTNARGYRDGRKHGKRPTIRRLCDAKNRRLLNCTRSTRAVSCLSRIIFDKYPNLHETHLAANFSLQFLIPDSAAARKIFRGNKQSPPRAIKTF